MPLRSVDVVKQRVDQRAGGVARRRMHDHSGRLVDDNEVGVLVQDVERQRFRRLARPDRVAGCRW